MAPRRSPALALCPQLAHGLEVEQDLKEFFSNVANLPLDEAYCVLYFSLKFFTSHLYAFPSMTQIGDTEESYLTRDIRFEVF